MSKSSDTVTLSASKLKTLETCSWSYWCSYHLKIPQKNNEGAMRGTICHLIFELLLKKGRKKHYNLIVKKGKINGCESINRLIIKHLNKDKINTEENYGLIDKMILVGLNADFYGKDGKLGEPEIEFNITSEDPKYKIKGFMDKLIFYEKDKTIKIVDYKSSKSRFKEEELNANFQAMMYSLASNKLWPKYKNVIVEFLFLRFPTKASQTVNISEDQKRGFEKYLAHIYSVILSFTEKMAKTNYAASSVETRWLCKAGATWRCPYLSAVDYFVLLDENGAILKSAFENNFSPKNNEKVELRKYDGCPAHKVDPSKEKDFFLD